VVVFREIVRRILWQLTDVLIARLKPKACPESHGAVSEYSPYRNPSGRLFNSQSVKHPINCHSEATNLQDSWLVKHSLDSSSTASFNILRCHIWTRQRHK
jgi:hypothetical protein